MPGSAATGVRAGVVAAFAAGAVHAAPAVTGRGRWRERVVPRLLGTGAPGGIALTFDDGPDADGTPAVLDALAQLGWRATFFLLGTQVQDHPSVARSIVRAGHEVAVHGHVHRNHLARTAPDLVRDVRLARDLVARATGASPRWFRPPYGVLSAGSLVAARAAGLRPVLWTAWGRDWLTRTPEQVAATVLGDLRERGTVLLHDSDCTSVAGSWRSSAAALPLLAERVRDRGWVVRTLSEHMAISGGASSGVGSAVRVAGRVRDAAVAS